MAKGYSLHIGINRIDPNHYGTEGILRGCENDAADMRKIAESCGFEAESLITQSATVSNVIGAMSASISKMKPGDMLLVTYAGHGAQVRDQDGDETKDKLDETWCLYDRMLLDDEVWRAIGGVPKGCRVLLVLDSCHSGSAARVIAPMMRDLLNLTGTRTGLKKREIEQSFVFRTLDEQIAQSAYDNHVELYEGLKRDLRASALTVKASVILLSACQDEETASDGTTNGKFTEALKSVWAEGVFQGDYDSFHRKIADVLGVIQHPNLSFEGELDTDYYRSTPLTIAGRRPEAISLAIQGPSARTPDEILDEIKASKRGLNKPGATVRWTLDIPLQMIEGLKREEVLEVISTEGVEAMMRTYFATTAISSVRGMEFEIECKETHEGRISCGAKLEHSN